LRKNSFISSNGLLKLKNVDWLSDWNVTKWKIYIDLHSKFVIGTQYLYILKQQWCLSVRAVPRRFFQSLPVPCGAGDKQGRAGQGKAGRLGQPREVPFLLKKSLGKTGGPTFNRTKIQFF
jgi:hypothetical protein